MLLEHLLRDLQEILVGGLSVEDEVPGEGVGNIGGLGRVRAFGGDGDDVRLSVGRNRDHVAEFVWSAGGIEILLHQGGHFLHRQQRSRRLHLANRILAPHELGAEERRLQRALTTLM
ncbi:MAG: hypothetical protein ACYC33_07285 [Thermoleophilia bacterium]